MDKNHFIVKGIFFRITYPECIQKYILEHENGIKTELIQNVIDCQSVILESIRKVARFYDFVFSTNICFTFTDTYKTKFVETSSSGHQRLDNEFQSLFSECALNSPGKSKKFFIRSHVES